MVEGELTTSAKVVSYSSDRLGHRRDSTFGGRKVECKFKEFGNR